MSDERKLTMLFYPKTIEHLGIKMYSTFPTALAELIANAYDAEATEVKISIYDRGDDKRIIVKDNGIGMSFQEIQDNFLVIGRNRREEEDKAENSIGRKIMGRKGLGKLALFGLGQKVTIETTKANIPEKITFNLDWDDMKNSNKDYAPTFTPASSELNEHGTTVTLSVLKRKTPFNATKLATDISRLFFGLDDKFKVSMSINDSEPIEITEDLRFKDLIREAEWEFPKFALDVDSGEGLNYVNKNRIKGFIFTTPKPLPSGLRGIYLFANKRMAASPSFFGLAESSHVFSYLTGCLNIDFINDGKEEVIATNRQAIDWEGVGMPELQEELKRNIRRIETEWRNKRTSRETKKLKDYEEELKKAVEEFKSQTSKNIADSLSNSKAPKTPQEIANAVNKQINKNLPIAGIKSKIYDSKKKILLSHTYQDKCLADLIYDMLLFNNVPAKDIIHYLSENEDSRLPENTKVFDYLRDFFVDSYDDRKIYVVYITSKNTPGSWGTVMEVGAGWITKSSWKIFNINDYMPQAPLNNGEEWHNSDVKDSNTISMTVRNVDHFCQKLEDVCNTLGYETKTRNENKKQLADFINIIPE
jgi:hypothetical protein